MKWCVVSFFLGAVVATAQTSDKPFAFNLRLDGPQTPMTVLPKSGPGVLMPPGFLSQAPQIASSAGSCAIPLTQVTGNVKMDPGMQYGVSGGIAMDPKSVVAGMPVCGAQVPKGLAAKTQAGPRIIP